ncbi:hypothetical protein HID58_003243 [Brassica napus]|uniref:Nucleotidyl transferase domain-containing protein n=1 Tax=Brassica napus TaxID=3708 RepID=A0ABQ8EPI9_BRANA|nr:hypothetical protein HID58_003243 [Brassica napus]
MILVSPESASQFGELVADPVTNELLHYTEKPETFVSDRINCCVYVFTPDIFTAIRLRDVSSQRKDTAILRRVSSFEALQQATSPLVSPSGSTASPPPPPLSFINDEVGHWSCHGHECITKQLFERIS